MNVAFVLDLESRCLWANVTDDQAILSACLMVLKVFCRTLGSGPRTCKPSNGAVLTVDKTWGWNPKFFNNASRRNNWRLEAKVCWIGTCWVLILCWVTTNCWVVHNPSDPQTCWAIQSWQVCWTRHLPTRHMLGRHLLGHHLPGRHLPGRHLPGHHLLVLWCDRENWTSRLDTKNNPDTSLESWVVSLEF